MSATYSQRADAFGRRHPRLMIAAIVLMAGVVTLVLLASSENPAVLYQAF